MNLSRKRSNEPSPALAGEGASVSERVRALTPTLSRVCGRGGAVLVTALLVLSTAQAHAQTKMIVGNVPSTTGGPIFIAKEKGYFAQGGLDVDLQRFRSAIDMEALLATGRLQVAAGSVGAGLFNTVEKKLPIKIVMSRASTPSFHNIVVRTDLKDTIKKIPDLKGRSIALNARGAVTMYEFGRSIESGGLTLKDVDVKFMPYDQMPVALANKAADAALIIPPNVDVAVEKGFAVRWIDPDHAVKVLPILVGVDQMNTDWAAKNEKAAFAFVEAVLRGAHDYCEAYHRGANRAEVVRIMAKYIDITDPAIVDAIEWGARDPEGRIFPASLDDIQEFYLQQGLIARKYTNDELFDDRYGEAARKKVGPFKLQAKSEKPGCR